MRRVLTTEDDIVSGTYTPTFSNASGLTIDSVEYVRWTRLLDTVRVDMTLTIDNPGGGSGVASVDISLPMDPGADFEDDSSATGHGSIDYGDSQGITIASVSGTRLVRATLRIGGEFPHDTRISLSSTYHISSS